MKKIILIRITGGLGNQLFIYNYYLLLRKRYPNHRIYFDKTPYEKFFSSERNDFSVRYKVHYVLDHFYRLNYLNKYLCKIIYRVAKINASGLKLITLPVLLDEKGIAKQPDFIDRCYITLIHGHFISKGFIQNCEELKFERSLTLNEVQSNLLKQISSGNSVSVHLRGGQYIKESNIKSEYVTITRAYYEKAIDFIKKNLKDPMFYVFTNDQDYAESFFSRDADQLTLVPSNPDHIDFYLMSNCKNNIIINSTFSWWAAYLNENKDKIVVAPRKWSGEIVVNPEYDKLPLESWIKF